MSYTNRTIAGQAESFSIMCFLFHSGILTLHTYWFLLGLVKKKIGRPFQGCLILLDSSKDHLFLKGFIFPAPWNCLDFLDLYVLLGMVGARKIILSTGKAKQHVVFGLFKFWMVRAKVVLYYLIYY